MRKPRPAEGEETSWKTWPGHAVFLWGKATQDVSRPPRRCARPFCGQLRVACSRNYNRRVCTSRLSLSSFLHRFPPPSASCPFPARGWKGQSRFNWTVPAPTRVQVSLRDGTSWRFIIRRMSLSLFNKEINQLLKLSRILFSSRSIVHSVMRVRERKELGD